MFGVDSCEGEQRVLGALFESLWIWMGPGGSKGVTAEFVIRVGSGAMLKLAKQINRSKLWGPDA